VDAIGDLLAGKQTGHARVHTSLSDVKTRPPGPVFFAIKPAPDDALDIDRTARELRVKNGLTGVPYSPDLLHVSLLCIGWRPEIREEVVERACVAGAAVTMRSFSVAFDRAATFGGESFVLFGGEGVVGIEMLQRALISELKKVGLDLKKHGYEPHMTLLHDPRRIMAQYIAPVRWKVREFSLIHTFHGHSQHVPLARWTLPSL
jgi:2'-5' RNA ligase